MGEIHIPIGTLEDHHWTPYMAQMLDAIVADWTERVELGAITKWANGSYEPISTEHLRIAKAYLNRTSPAQVDTLVMTKPRTRYVDPDHPSVGSITNPPHLRRMMDPRVSIDILRKTEYVESFDQAENQDDLSAPEDLGDAWKSVKEDRAAARKARIDAARQVLVDEGVELLERRDPSPGRHE